MRWKIEGADGRTGQEISFHVDAPTREEAEQIALANKVLVSRVSRAAADQQQFARKSAEEPEPDVQVDLTSAPPPGHKAPPKAPAYPEIVTGAGVLRFLGALLYGFAGVLLLVALLGLVVAILMLTGDIGTRESRDAVRAGAASIVGSALALLTGAFWSFAGGAVLRMLGSVGLAVRDAARNSFK